MMEVMPNFKFPDHRVIRKSNGDMKLESLKDGRFIVLPYGKSVQMFSDSKEICLTPAVRWDKHKKGWVLVGSCQSTGIIV
jgi:hypothetical protein